MSTQRILDRLALPGALLLAPAAWMLNTQLGPALPHLDCATGWRLSALGSLLCLGSALAGLALSVRAGRRSAGGPSDGAGTARFLARIGLLLALLLAFALALQGAASMLLTGCER